MIDRILALLIFIGLPQVASAQERIIAWGDSLTAGAGATESYPAVADSILPDFEVINEGLGGQTSHEIAARMGAVPLVLELGETIGNSRLVKAYSANVLRVSGKNRGRLSGVFHDAHGELTTDEDGQWTLTFDGPLPEADKGDFIPDAVDQYGDAPVWIWAGRNNLQDVETVLNDIAAMVGNRPPPRYLILSVLSARNDGKENLKAISRINSALAETYGERFLDIGELLYQKALNKDGDASLTPEEFLSDHIHLNKAGYAYVGTHVALCWVGICN